MKRWLLILILTVICSPAGVMALESSDEWDQQIDANGTITLSEGQIEIVGSNNVAPGQPWINTVTGITTDSSTGETVSFEWSFYTTDNAYYDRPQVLANGTWSDLANYVQQASGTWTDYIAAGGLFGFRVLSLDSCCGSGTLTVTNTNWVIGPTPTPSAEPSVDPSPEPSPTPEPTPEPTPTPTPEPTPEPTQKPTPDPVPDPSVEPTPSPEPTVEPEPSVEPTPEPTTEPEPTAEPTPAPSVEPTPAPTEQPVVEPGDGDSPIVDLSVVGETFEAAFEAILNITEIGKDLDAGEKAAAQPVAVALVSTQVAAAAAAAAGRINRRD